MDLQLYLPADLLDTKDDQRPSANKFYMEWLVNISTSMSISVDRLKRHNTTFNAFPTGSKCVATPWHKMESDQTSVH